MPLETKQKKQVKRRKRKKVRGFEFESVFKITFNGGRKYILLFQAEQPTSEEVHDFLISKNIQFSCMLQSQGGLIVTARSPAVIYYAEFDEGIN